jgi:hypothetical protein
LEISSSSLNFRLSLVDIDALKPHEETIDQAVRALSKEMRIEGMVRDPLMVDQDELVVLDGMHRCSALRMLKCRFVPCCLLDYDSGLVKVSAWYRLFRVPEAESLAEMILRENNLTYSRHESDSYYDPQALLLARNGLEFLSTKTMEPIEHARTAVQLEKSLTRNHHRVEYLSEVVAVQRLKSGSVNLVVPVPAFSKQQIRDFARRSILLPHKVTRHVIPSRPLHVNIPLKVLTDLSLTQTEGNRKLGDVLAKRHVNRKPPGSVVDGRRYEEELLVFVS